MKLFICFFTVAIAVLAPLSTGAQGSKWQVGDQAYLWNYWNNTQKKDEFVLVEIDDVRGDRVKVIARAACNDNGWAGKGCKTGWFPPGGKGMQKDDSKWVRISELLTSWESDVKMKLKYEDTKVGTGAEARAGQSVRVHYTGWLWVDGRRGDKFDSSRDRGQPFSFPLGGGRVIKGWDEGVAGMRIGGTRILTIPPELGYGSSGAGDSIPPRATLQFEVELLGVQ